MTDDYAILELIKNDSLTIRTTNTSITSMTTVAAPGQGTLLAPLTLKSLDFCYADEDAVFTLLNCFDVCVTVGKLKGKGGSWKSMRGWRSVEEDERISQAGM
jgi:hypothetical protein